jgi:hypothetical protein
VTQHPARRFSALDPAATRPARQARDVRRIVAAATGRDGRDLAARFVK